MLYFDSTYLFRIYSVEPGHGAVKNLLAQTNQPVATAWHGRAEIASILLRKRREGADTPEHLSSLAKQFQDVQSPQQGFPRRHPWIDFHR